MVVSHCLIHPAQHGGLPGLSSATPMAILVEVINHANRNKLPIFLLAHDLANGFNSVSFASISFALRRRGLELLEFFVLSSLKGCHAIFSTRQGEVRVEVTKANHPSVVWSGAYLMWRGGPQGVMRQVRPSISSNKNSLSKMADFVSVRTKTFNTLANIKYF